MLQAKFSTDTGQQNVLGDVTILQNSQLIVKSKAQFFSKLPVSSLRAL